MHVGHLLGGQHSRPRRKEGVVAAEGADERDGVHGCMSKRGLVAYSDALRYEHGREISVTTVYPGYVSTPIHDASKEGGFTLEGLVPVEELDAVAERVAQAALGKPVRDLATTPRGTLGYAMLRRLPRRLVDVEVMATIRRRARTGAFAESSLAGEFARALQR